MMDLSDEEKNEVLNGPGLRSVNMDEQEVSIYKSPNPLLNQTNSTKTKGMKKHA